MSETISISQFEADCLNWLVNVNKTGKSIMVTRKDKQIALIKPPPQQSQWLDCMKDRIQIHSDIISPTMDEDETERIGKLPKCSSVGKRNYIFDLLEGTSGDEVSEEWISSIKFSRTVSPLKDHFK